MGYGIAEKEEKEKMEELLLNFMKEDDFHIQERMEEEPIKVERQIYTLFSSTKPRHVRAFQTRCGIYRYSSGCNQGTIDRK